MTEEDHLRGRAYVIIGGPQASGKSHAQRHLVRTYKNIVALREAGQILLEREREEGSLLGGALVDKEFEKMVLQLDLERMREIPHEPSNKIYLDESNIFAVAHARVKNPDLAEILFLKYSQALSSFNAGVIFVHVAPEVSWERRERVYTQRYRGSPNYGYKMKRSKDYVFRIYPFLMELYRTLPYPKRQVEGTVLRAEFEKNVETAFESICDEIGATFERKF